MKFAFFAGIFLSAACAQAGFAQDIPAIHNLRTHPPRTPVPTGPVITTSAASPVSVPMWTGTDGTYTYTMVGQSPVTALANPSTTISTQILPVALVFSDGTKLDPTVVDNTCSPAGTALSLLESSPIFNNFAYTVGGTSVGATQYHDFFQRANFWSYTGPSGVNPGYHILLSPAPHAVTTITVPPAEGQTIAASCGRLGEVSLPWLDTYLQNTVFPAAGVLPTQFAVVLLYNSVTYEPSAPGSLILGYHSAFSNTATNGAFQTYAVGDFDTTGSFGTTKDTADLSHEIAEWMNDPLGSNPTPPWGNIGQVTGCQSNLEVGDPLSGTNITVTMTNGYVYHLQELAFASWFYHDSPSKGVNGWYSSNDTFTTSAAACAAPTTATTTTLSLSATTVTPGTSVTAAVAVKAATGTGVPAGMVSLVTSTGTALGTFTLLNGTSSGSIVLAAGSYTVTAEYKGDSNFTASNSPAVSVVAAAAVATTTTLTLSATAVTPATQVTYSIAVKASSGTATPSGSVSLLTNTGTTLATASLTNGTASGSLTFPAGTYTVTAKYAGTTAFTASASAPVGVTSATPAATTTTLTLGATTVAAGTSVTATIAVKPTTGKGTPTGNVALVTSTGTTLATLTLASGAASGSVVLAAGSYTVTAEYAGSTAFAASNSAPVSVVSTPIPTTTTLSFSSTALPSGGADTATITVKPTSGTGTPTGTVALVSSTGTKITTVTLSAGAFSGSVTLPSGSFTVTAEYSGAATFAASNSTAVAINPAAVLTLSPAALTFASTKTGTTAAAQTVTVKNAGNAAATALAISDSGADASDFTWTTTCTASLAVNASCTISVSFKPAATGARTANLSVAGGTSPSTVTLSGTGK